MVDMQEIGMDIGSTMMERESIHVNSLGNELIDTPNVIEGWRKRVKDVQQGWVQSFEGLGELRDQLNPSELTEAELALAIHFGWAEESSNPELTKHLQGKYAPLFADVRVQEAHRQLAEIKALSSELIHAGASQQLADWAHTMRGRIDYRGVLEEQRGAYLSNNSNALSLWEVLRDDQQWLDRIESPINQEDADSDPFSVLQELGERMEAWNTLTDKYAGHLLDNPALDLSQSDTSLIEFMQTNKEDWRKEEASFDVVGQMRGKESRMTFWGHLHTALHDEGVWKAVSTNESLHSALTDLVADARLDTRTPILNRLNDKELQVVQYTWKEKLAHTTTQEMTEAEQAVTVVVDRYQRVVGGNHREADIRTKQADRAFVSSVLETFADRSFSQLELRLLQSDMLAMHYLLVGGGMEELVADYEQKNNTELALLSSHERQQIENQLLTSFMQTFRQRAGEEQYYVEFRNSPSFGLELEEQHVALSLVRHYLTLQKAKAELSSPDSVSLDTINFKNTQWLMNDFYRKQGALVQPIDQYTAALNYLMMYRLDDQQELQLDYAAYVDRELQSLSKILGLTDDAESNSQKLVDLAGYAMEVPIARERLNRIAPYNSYRDRRSPEYAGHPGLSPNITMREVWLLCKEGMLDSPGTAHFTVSDVEVRPGRTSFFEVGMILGGAGWLGDDLHIFETKDIEMFLNNPNMFDEGVIKWSEIDGRLMLVPFMRMRNLQEASTPGDGFDVREYVHSQTVAAEIRLGKIDQSTSPRDVVRSGAFVWLSAWGERAEAQSVSVRSGGDNQLAEAWNDLMQNWATTKSEFGIEDLLEADKCIDIHDELTEAISSGNTAEIALILKRAAKPASNYYAKIEHTSSTSPAFRKACRKLVFDYSRRVKEILGLLPGS